MCFHECERLKLNCGKETQPRAPSPTISPPDPYLVLAGAGARDLTLMLRVGGVAENERLLGVPAAQSLAAARDSDVVASLHTSVAQVEADHDALGVLGLGGLAVVGPQAAAHKERRVQGILGVAKRAPELTQLDLATLINRQRTVVTELVLSIAVRVDHVPARCVHVT